MKRITVLSFASTFFLSATLAHATNVRIDYNHRVDFGNYHTYSWGPVTTTSPFFVHRIKAKVDADLQAKGWQLVPSGGNATVFATDNIKNQQETETMYNNLGGGWGGGWGWGGFGGFGGGFGPGGFGEADTTQVNQRVGHLVLDIFDTSSRQLLFRGVSDDDLSNNEGKNTHTVDKDLDKMVKDFPPKGKK